MLAYTLMAADAGSLEQAFRLNAESEWSGATEKELSIATAYEGFWAGALLALCAQALACAWLFDGRTRAKLAMVFGMAMLAFFMPGLIFVSSRYDISCGDGGPNDANEHSFAAHCGLIWAWLAMGTVLTLILVSGAVHLCAGVDAHTATHQQLH